MYEYAVKEVVKVVDGDTVDVIVDLGFDILHKTRVRLYGINTPDEDMYPRPSSLLLSTKEKGKFGRYLGTFYKAYWDSDKEEYIKLNLNETLVEEGHATEYFGGKR